MSSLLVGIGSTLIDSLLLESTLLVSKDSSSLLAGVKSSIGIDSSSLLETALVADSSGINSALSVGISTSSTTGTTSLSADGTDSSSIPKDCIFSSLTADPSPLIACICSLLANGNSSSLLMDNSVLTDIT